jgi:hypothetical protein
MKHDSIVLTLVVNPDTLVIKSASDWIIFAPLDTI